jgi:antitoxin (DNA-binding transcriptional repressor) of toxin-antitoxin stability system
VNGLIVANRGLPIAHLIALPQASPTFAIDRPDDRRRGLRPSAASR